eukprot:CAMPEP_0175053804 /NCGR_PEP_ID=MMETSP0052_2-20121109/9138_1 /TAXON_ID=51329 ORGANISM="Polytomella parva, Strain SAG 63-3" /NCGR_SAMPLE_ID=MMETSP0052_2 /ASSEMBLY_ACC=CAM_ASM_000194 /LENGTH=474 /DNA_ID=CAMNT_0016318399 /DNA_START=71 /DNA_END=1491 /DNA_ORIENTATION=+
MSMSHIPASGIVTAYAESAKDCLSWESRPPTPPEMKRFRQSTIHEPGKILRHYGVANDPIPEGTFGRKTNVCESVGAVLKNYPSTEISRWKYEQAEKVYASNKREPLGTGYVRGHKIPDGLGTERPFGVVYGAKEKEECRQAASIVFPNDILDQYPDKSHALYVKSHSSFAPGEQRRRNYEWDSAGVDPATFRFGATEKGVLREGVKKALQPMLDETAAQPPKIATKVHEDFKSTAIDYLGRPRILGAGQTSLDPNHTFGVPSLKDFEYGVGETLRGAYSIPEQQPDANLGKSLREGFRNMPRVGDENHIFGTPSIRTDLSLPRRRGVADTRNFGNEPDALQLLRPPRSAERGVGDQHYVILRKRDEIRALVKDAQLNLTEAEFDRVFDYAAAADSNQVYAVASSSEREGAGVEYQSSGARGNDGMDSQRGGGGGGSKGYGMESSIVAADVCCLDTFFKVRHHLLAQEYQMPVS